MIAYVETSAAAKLFVVEVESVHLEHYLLELSAGGDSIVSSALLETELRRAAVRQDLPQRAVTAVLARFDVFDVDRSTYAEAGLIPGATLRSLGALHVAAARRIGADVMVSYDQRQLDSAESSGLRTVSPR